MSLLLQDSTIRLTQDTSKRLLQDDIINLKGWSSSSLASVGSSTSQLATLGSSSSSVG